MPLPTEDDYDAVHDRYDDAIGDLFVAVAGETVPRGPYSTPVYDAAEKVVEAFQAMQAVYNYTRPTLRNTQPKPNGADRSD